MTGVSVHNVPVVPVPNGEYRSTTAQLISSAYRRCLCSLFIVDINPDTDHDLHVNALLQHLARTAWSGADARLLIGGSRTNIAIAEASNAATKVAKEYGIAARWISARPGRGSHIKLVIADDRVLLGSHNWSGGALAGNQRQDSLLIMSIDLAEYYTFLFNEQWTRAGRT